MTKGRNNKIIKVRVSINKKKITYKQSQSIISAISKISTNFCKCLRKPEENYRSTFTGTQINSFLCGQNADEKFVDLLNSVDGMTDGAEGQCGVSSGLFHHHFHSARMIVDQFCDVVDFVIEDDPAIVGSIVPGNLFQRIFRQVS